MSSAMNTPWRWRRQLAVGAAALAAGAGPAAAMPPHALAASTSRSVVVVERAGAGDAPEAAVRAAGGRVVRELPLIGGFAARVPAGAVPVLRARADVRTVTRDRRLSLRSTDEPAPGPAVSLAVARRVTGAAALPSDGAGVDVALVDTGVARVAGLQGRVVDGADFSADAADPSKRFADAFGHGTHLAGAIAGSDPATGFSGIAPGARVVNVRVADHDGDTSLVRLLSGIDWTVRNADRDGMNIRVLALAVGGPADGGYRDDPLALAVERAWRSGLTVVVAAGNSGTGSAALDSPAYDPYPIAVGAQDTADTTDPGDDHVADFSSRGSTARTPDVVAPGVGIVSLRVPGSLLDQSFPAARAGDGFFRGSGTSQSAAVASGAVAVLLAERPTLDPDAVKALLRASGHPLAGFDERAQGAGALDVAAAAALPVPADARQAWTRARGGGPWRARSVGVQMAAENTGAWDANLWRANLWRANLWRANLWRANLWRGDAWRGDTWTAAQWTGSSWTAPSD